MKKFISAKLTMKRKVMAHPRALTTLRVGAMRELRRNNYTHLFPLSPLIGYWSPTTTSYSLMKS